MIAFLTLIYVAVLAVLVRLKILPNSAGTWLSTLGWSTLLLLVLFIPMQWGAPSGAAAVVARTVQIIPNVSGEVVEVSARPNAPVAAGAPLFRIDPEPFEIALAQAEASLARMETVVEQDRERLASAEAQLAQAVSARALAQRRFDDDAVLVERGAIPANRLDERTDDLQAARSAEEAADAQVQAARLELGAVVADGTPAKLAEAQAAQAQAEWNLAQTEVTAPGEGFVTFLALAEGQRVTNFPFAPSMIYVDTSELTLAASINQIHLRFVEPGQEVEIAFKTRPGEVIAGRVEQVVPAASQGQMSIAGAAPQAGLAAAEPFFVRVKLAEGEAWPPVGAAATVAIYTDQVRATHLIRRVMIRMQAILNYILPAL
ncbi:MAG: efflux RND transporter periplasmic adaptor subunit [Pseudomonadota bacterium]